MADPFKDITLKEFEETTKAIDTRKNIIETNPGDKVRVVRPKTTGASFVETLRSDPKSFGMAFALDYINKERKKRGEDLILDEQLDSDQTTAGREFQAAVLGAGANIGGG